MLNSFSWEEEIGGKLMVGDSYVMVKTRQNQVMILFFEGKMEKNWIFIVY